MKFALFLLFGLNLFAAPDLAPPPIASTEIPESIVSTSYLISKAIQTEKSSRKKSGT